MSWLWLNEWNLTPMDLGVEEVDPVWDEAMLLIQGGYNEEREKKAKSIG